MGDTVNACGWNSFGEYLRDYRQYRKFSLRELGKLVNVDFTYLSKIERNIIPPPSSELIKKLAITLNMSQDIMFSLAGKLDDDIKHYLIKNPVVIGDIRELMKSKVNPDD